MFPLSADELAEEGERLGQGGSLYYRLFPLSADELAEKEEKSLADVGSEKGKELVV